MLALTVKLQDSWSFRSQNFRNPEVLSQNFRNSWSFAKNCSRKSLIVWLKSDSMKKWSSWSNSTLWVTPKKISTWIKKIVWKHLGANVGTDSKTSGFLKFWVENFRNPEVLSQNFRNSWSFAKICSRKSLITRLKSDSMPKWSSYPNRVSWFTPQMI